MAFSRAGAPEAAKRRAARGVSASPAQGAHAAASEASRRRLAERRAARERRQREEGGGAQAKESAGAWARATLEAQAPLSVAATGSDGGRQEEAPPLDAQGAQEPAKVVSLQQRLAETEAELAETQKELVAERRLLVEERSRHARWTEVANQVMAQQAAMMVELQAQRQQKLQGIEAALVASEDKLAAREAAVLQKAQQAMGGVDRLNARLRLLEMDAAQWEERVVTLAMHAESVAEASSVLLSGADNAAAAELKRLRVRAELAETAYLSEKEHAAGMAQRLAEAAASGGVERELYEAEKELAVISAAAMQ